MNLIDHTSTFIKTGILLALLFASGSKAFSQVVISAEWNTAFSNTLAQDTISPSSQAKMNHQLTRVLGTAKRIKAITSHTDLKKSSFQFYIDFSQDKANAPWWADLYQNKVYYLMRKYRFRSFIS